MKDPSPNQLLYLKAKKEIASGRKPVEVLKEIGMKHNVYGYYHAKDLGLSSYNNKSKAEKLPAVRDPLRAMKAPQVTSFIVQDVPSQSQMNLVILQGETACIERALSLIYKNKT